jgi:DNA-directed RNA polymerase sigma subunit (sigma70/sigma32)
MDVDDPNDPIAVYLREVASVERLTAEQQFELFRQLGRSNDWDEQQENVARRLLESQLWLVAQIAERHSASGFPMLDLIQEGNIGLMNAVRSFADNPTGDFSTHAAACIEDAIGKFVNKQ